MSVTVHVSVLVEFFQTLLFRGVWQFVNRLIQDNPVKVLL